MEESSNFPAETYAKVKQKKKTWRAICLSAGSIYLAHLVDSVERAFCAWFLFIKARPSGWKK